MIIKISDWSETPGARKRAWGRHSAEEFRDDHLIPAVNQALQDGVQLTVDLNGTAGIAASFLEEVFGGIVRIIGYDKVQKVIRFAEPDAESQIMDYPEDAQRFMLDARPHLQQPFQD